MATIEAVATKVRSVTKSDSTDLTLNGSAPRALYIGTTGDVAVIAAGDTAAVTFSSVPVGWFPIAVRKVMSTNTTASNIVALYE